MPRPRKPVAVARVTGAALKNPQRYSGRTEAFQGPVGEPYENMTDAEQTWWETLAGEFPWLSISDRQALREVSEMLSERDSYRLRGEPVPIGIRREIRLHLSSFGGNPSDRSRVKLPEMGDPDDPAAKYLT